VGKVRLGIPECNGSNICSEQIIVCAVIFMACATINKQSSSHAQGVRAGASRVRNTWCLSIFIGTRILIDTCMLPEHSSILITYATIDWNQSLYVVFCAGGLCSTAQKAVQLLWMVP
jgi:hypothetical protein